MYNPKFLNASQGTCKDQQGQAGPLEQEAHPRLQERW